MRTAHPESRFSTSRFVDLATVADILAISVGKAYDLVRTGELPALQIGGRRQWRVETLVLETFIAHQYEQTAASLRTQAVTTGR